MVAKFDSKTEARKLIGKADKKALTITGETLMSYVSTFIELSFREIASLNKIFTSSSQQIEEGAKAAILLDEAIYASDYALLSKTFDHVYSYMWQRANREEAAYIKERMIDMNDNIFIYNFFYGRHRNGMNISPIISKISKELWQTYGVRLTPGMLSAMFLDAMWSDGSWYPLKRFRGDCSIYTWIEKIGRQRIIKSLEKDGLLKVKKEKTLANTRVNFDSVDKDLMAFIIDECVYSEDDKSLLSLIYLSGLSEENIMRMRRLDKAAYNARVKKATDKMIDNMLRHPYDFSNILSEKEKRNIDIALENINEYSDTVMYIASSSSLDDIFGVNLTDAEIQDKSLEVLYTVSLSMGWDKEDLYVWQERYFSNTDPKVVAQTLGRTRGWVDTRYNRLQKLFSKAVRKWALLQNWISESDVRAIEEKIARKQEENARQRAQNGRRRA